MGRLIQWNLISLDGYFEGAKSWDVEWFHSAWNKELEQFSLEQLRSAGMLIFGRVTYEGMAAYWQTAEGATAELMNGLPKAVFARSVKMPLWANTRLISDDPAAAVRRLKQETAPNLFVFGSGKLAAALLEQGLFDEVRLALVPVVLGRGSTLFGRDLSRTGMKLLEARPLRNGCVILRYEPLER